MYQISQNGHSIFSKKNLLLLDMMPKKGGLEDKRSMLMLTRRASNRIV